MNVATPDISLPFSGTSLQSRSSSNDFAIEISKAPLFHKSRENEKFQNRSSNGFLLSASTPSKMDTVKATLLHFRQPLFQKIKKRAKRLFFSPSRHHAKNSLDPVPDNGPPQDQSYHQLQRQLEPTHQRRRLQQQDDLLPDPVKFPYDPYFAKYHRPFRHLMQDPTTRLCGEMILPSRPAMPRIPSLCMLMNAIPLPPPEYVVCETSSASEKGSTKDGRQDGDEEMELEEQDTDGLSIQKVHSSTPSEGLMERQRVPIYEPLQFHPPIISTPVSILPSDYTQRLATGTVASSTFTSSLGTGSHAAVEETSEPILINGLTSEELINSIRFEFDHEGSPGFYGPREFERDQEKKRQAEMVGREKKEEERKQRNTIESTRPGFAGSSSRSISAKFLFGVTRGEVSGEEGAKDANEGSSMGGANVGATLIQGGGAILETVSGVAFTVWTKATITLANALPASPGKALEEDA